MLKNTKNAVKPNKTHQYKSSSIGNTKYSIQTCPKCDHHVRGRVVTNYTKHNQGNQSQDRQSLCGLSVRINEQGRDIRPGTKSNPIVESHSGDRNLRKCII